MAFEFVKFHGFGNDYIVIDAEELSANVDLSRLAIQMCERHTGVGGDGIAVLTRSESEDADFFCEIVNPDGSIAGFSGNGTRCAVACLHYLLLWADRELRLETRSGIKKYTLVDRRPGGEFWFDAEIGTPKFSSDAVPIATSEVRPAVVNEPIEVEGQVFKVSAVNVGNPVAAIFVDDFDFDWRSVGRTLECHPIFPEKANIVFVKVIDRSRIEVRIWERAAGETSSSGTCCSAAAVLSAFTLRTDRTVDVQAVGGVTKVVWREDDTIVINGRADLAFSGVWSRV